jgi:hypothetical protein
MHSFGHVHRDVYARNILVRLDEDGPRIWFLDCRRGGPPSWRSGTWDDLATLDADWKGRWPRSDRLATLRAYLSDDEAAGPALAVISKRRGKVRTRAWT